MMSRIALQRLIHVMMLLCALLIAYLAFADTIANAKGAKKKKKKHGSAGKAEINQKKPSEIKENAVFHKITSDLAQSPKKRAKYSFLLAIIVAFLTFGDSWLSSAANLPTPSINRAPKYSGIVLDVDGAERLEYRTGNQESDEPWQTYSPGQTIVLEKSGYLYARVRSAFLFLPVRGEETYRLVNVSENGLHFFEGETPDTDLYDIYYRNNVYEISSVRGMEIFRDIVNGENAESIPGLEGDIVPNDQKDIDGILVSDLDFSELSEPWKPIGYKGRGYYGMFNGNGHSITNFTATYDNNDLCYANEDTSGEVITGGAGLFAMSKGSILNLAISGEIHTNVERVGGITGINRGDIYGCISDVDIIADSGDPSKPSEAHYFGGIAGTNETRTSRARINYCAYYGTIHCEQADNPRVGGITGGNWKNESDGGCPSVFSCFNVGTIELPADAETDSVGGIAGKLVNDSIFDCWYSDTCCNVGPLSDQDVAKAYDLSRTDVSNLLRTLNRNGDIEWVSGSPYPVLKKFPQPKQFLSAH